MRPLLRALPALALLALAAPAHAGPPRGELVLVADGTAAATFALPATVDLDLERATYETRSPYAVVLFAQGGHEAAVAVHLAAVRGDESLISPARVRAGRATVRSLAGGPGTVRIPATGLAGRRVVRVRDRLSGTFARMLKPAIVGTTARSDVPLTVARSSLTIHGYYNPPGLTAGRVDALCVTPEADGCLDHAEPTPVATVTGHAVYYWPEDGLAGAQHAQLTIAEPGTVADVTEYVFSLPAT